MTLGVAVDRSIKSVVRRTESPFAKQSKRTRKVNSEPSSMLCHKNKEFLLLSETSDERSKYLR